MGIRRYIYLSILFIIVCINISFLFAADIFVTPNSGQIFCNSGEYSFDVKLNTDSSNVIASDVKFFLEGLDLVSIQNLSGFDNLSYIGTGVSTKGTEIGQIYHYVNVYQNSFANFISGSDIPLFRLNLFGVEGYANGYIKFYNLFANDEDSNISVGVDKGLSDMPLKYIDFLNNTTNGNYVLVNCGEVNTGDNGSSGGGGGGSVSKDYCPDGDFSPSYYDDTCGDVHSSADICNINNSNYSSELKGAYLYSYMYGITTMCPIEDANLDGYLQRNHFAKMISEFAVNVLGKIPNIGKEGCDQFDDIRGDTEELKYFMKTACELDLMGLHADGVTPKDSFDPNQYVTRAQFGTVFSRLLFGEEYNVYDESEIYKKEGYWYKDHLEALKDNGIMTKIDGDWPNKLELRGYVMLMMQRADNYGIFAGMIPALNGIDALFGE